MAELQKYLGTKIVFGEPMTRQAYNDYRGWQLPADENGDDEGYLVEYIDGGRGNVSDRTGYVSWSPKDVFEQAYRQVEHLTFGQAIEAMKKGFRVARTGWNGRGMFLYYVGPGRYPPTTLAGRLIAMDQPDGLVPYTSYIAMKTVQGDVVPWLASQTDVLAEDWGILFDERDQNG